MSFIPYLIHPLRERFLQIEPKQDTFDVTGISIGHRERSYTILESWLKVLGHCTFANIMVFLSTKLSLPIIRCYLMFIFLTQSKPTILKLLFWEAGARKSNKILMTFPLKYEASHRHFVISTGTPKTLFRPRL